MKTYATHNQGQLGFTLMETLITVSIIVLTVAIAAPSLSDWTPLYRLKGDTRVITNLMQSARFEAIKRNRTVNIECAAPGNCTVYVDVDDNNLFDAATDDFINDYTLDTKVQFGTDLSGEAKSIDFLDLAGNPDPNGNIVFSPDGMSSSGNLYLQLNLGEVSTAQKSMSIVIETSGNLTLRKWDCNENKWKEQT